MSDAQYKHHLGKNPKRKTIFVSNRYFSFTHCKENINTASICCTELYTTACLCLRFAYGSLTTAFLLLAYGLFTACLGFIHFQKVNDKN